MELSIIVSCSPESVNHKEITYDLLMARRA